MSNKIKELLQYFYEFAVLNDDGEDQASTKMLNEAAVELGHKPRLKIKEWIKSDFIRPDLPDGTAVKVRLRDYELDQILPVENWRWDDSGGMDDITHYQIIG